MCLNALKRNFDKVTVKGAITNWGWSDDDHSLFLKLERQWKLTGGQTASSLHLHRNRLQVMSFIKLNVVDVLFNICRPPFLRCQK